MNVVLKLWDKYQTKKEKRCPSNWGRQSITKCSHEWQEEYSEVFEDKIVVCKFCRKVKVKVEN